MQNSKKILLKAKYWVLKNYTGYLFIMPLLFGTLIFCLVPFFQSMYLSFTDYNMMTPAEWVGLENYKAIFGVDWKDIFHSLKVTFLYTFLSVPITIVLSYLLAVLLNRKIKGMYFFRVLIYLPCIIPPIASAIVWKDIVTPEFGIMDNIFSRFGVEGMTWLTSADTALFTIIFMSFWGLGGGMILWLATLKNIPVELYEAANIDGANKFVQLIKITIPMSTAMIFYNLVNGLIGSMQMFGSFLITDNFGRGPDDSLYFISVRIYNEAFRNFNMGYASALSWVLFVIIALMSLLVFKQSKWVFYGEDM